MIVDWRRTFSHLGVAWIDRGANHTRGNVNIRCPYCHDDPSYHMGVSEEKEAFYCYRDSRHAGRSFIALLIRMGCSRTEAVSLLNEYGDGKRRKPEAAPIFTREHEKTRFAWDRFTAAQDCPAMLAYLKGRGFSSPAITCNAYGLRWASEGEWARRLLIPFSDHKREIFTWVGRAIDSAGKPRYLMENEKVPGAIYLPRLPRKVLHIVEGPIDALKVAVSTELLDVTPIALAGKGVTDSKLVRLQAFAKNCAYALLSYDPGVALGERMAVKRQIAATLKIPVRMLPVPEGCEDPGAMSITQVQDWLIPNI